MLPVDTQTSGKRRPMTFRSRKEMGKGHVPAPESVEDPLLPFTEQELKVFAAILVVCLLIVVVATGELIWMIAHFRAEIVQGFAELGVDVPL